MQAGTPGSDAPKRRWREEKRAYVCEDGTVVRVETHVLVDDARR